MPFIFPSSGCLDPENFKKFKLVEKKQISHNVARFKFALPTPTSVLGLPIGQHISCRFGFRLMPFFMKFATPFFLHKLEKCMCYSFRGQDATGEEVIKPYTPTTLDSDLGHFELVIKVNCIQFFILYECLFVNPGTYRYVPHKQDLPFNFSHNADVPSRKNVTPFP